MSWTNHFTGVHDELEKYFNDNEKCIAETFKDQIVFDVIQYLAYLSLPLEEQESTDIKNLKTNLENTRYPLLEDDDYIETTLKKILDTHSNSINQGFLVNSYNKSPITKDDFLKDNLVFDYNKSGTKTTKIKKGNRNCKKYPGNIVVSTKSVEKIKEKKKLIGKVKSIIKKKNPKIYEKVKNIEQKTGRYDVPTELFQQRTSRTGRVLISLSTVMANKLTIKDLEYFEGGVVVEFVNDDYLNFLEKRSESSVASELLNRIGSDDKVSSMISFRGIDGKSSGALPKRSYEAFLEYWQSNPILVKGSNIQPEFETEDKDKLKFENYRIIRKDDGTNNINNGNDKWKGFLYVSVKGGDKETISSHSLDKKDKKRCYLFNPAREYANEEVCNDILLVLLYLIMHSFDLEDREENSELLKEIEDQLKETEYKENEDTFTLFDYCKEKLNCIKDDDLVDPLTKESIKFQYFAYNIGKTETLNLGTIDLGTIDERDVEVDWDCSIDVAHREAAKFQKFYVDDIRKTILTAARPTNLFWAFHTSNMIQQNFTMEELLDIIKLLNRKHSQEDS